MLDGFLALAESAEMSGTVFFRCLILLALVVAADASAQCIDVVNVRSDLPHEVTTPNGTSVSYFYNLANDQYVVLTASDGGREVSHGPFVLTRGCVPGHLQWESAEFVLLQAGCGTFCWYVSALPLHGEDLSQQTIQRPLAFDADRNLVVSYSQQDTITITNLVSGKQQHTPTARQCLSASEVCFTVEFTGDELTYTWKYAPLETFLVQLDGDLISQ